MHAKTYPFLCLLLLWVEVVVAEVLAADLFAPRLFGATVVVVVALVALLAVEMAVWFFQI